MPTKFSTSKYQDTAALDAKPIPPERALFRLKGRAFEGDDDPYWAHENLAPNQQLPDSELLKAIHAYAADFYSKSYGEEASVDFCSLDETALICLGILLEEMADGVLGDTGDLAFTESENVQPYMEGGKIMKSDRASGETQKETPAMSATGEPTEGEEDSASIGPRASKRRKLEHNSTDG